MARVGPQRHRKKNECVIVMSIGRKVKKFLTTKETLSESTETISIINLT